MQNDRLDHLQGLMDAQQWDQAWLEFTRLQSEGPSPARLLFLGSHVAHARSDLFTARHLAEASLNTRATSDPQKLLGQIRFHLGMVTRELGDTYVALQQFQGFLEELSGLYPELSMGEAKAYYFLGLTLRQRCDFAGAIQAYKQAITCCKRDGLTSLLGMCLRNLAWLHCLQHESVEARTYLEEASQCVTSQRERVHQLLGEAHLALVEQSYLMAAQHCESVFQQADRGEPVTSQEQSQAAWIAGMVALRQGNVESANQLAAMALTYGTEARDSRLINDASSLRREINARQQAGA